MKQKTFLAMLFAMCVVFANAQEIISDEETKFKKEVNDLKRSENVVYAEVLEYMADDSNEKITVAQQKSMQLLQTHVIEIFAKRMKMDKKDVQEIWDVIDDKCQNVEVRKGDIVRVFTYVMKDALGLSRTKPKEKDIQEYFGSETENSQDSTIVAATTVPADTVATIQGNETVSSSSDTTVTSAVVATTVPTAPINETPVEISVDDAQSETTPTQTDTLIITTPVITEPVVTTPVTTEPVVTTPVATEPVATTPVTTEPATTTPVVTTPVVTTPTVTTPAPAPAQKESVADVKIPDLCKTLLEKKDMTSLLTYLDTEKAYEKLIYGSFRTMRKVEECYIVILDKSTRQIVTVLDKGKTDRMNFVTKKMDNYNNYRGGGNYSAVFVQEL